MDRIDDLNRSERYFTATVLPYLLAFNSFKHVDEFISSLNGPTPPTEDELNSIELITELDFVRDLRKYAELKKEPDLSEKYDGLFQEVGRLAVPDIVIKYGNVVVLIEGKFFQKERAPHYEAQISLQNELIELINEEFPDFSFFHVFLTADSSIEQLKGIDRVIYWQDEVQKLANRMSIQYPDNTELVYFKDRLENAIARYIEEFERPTDRSEIQRFDELSDLIKFLTGNKDDCFVGFDGGYQALLRLTLQQAQERSHWKVKERPSRNRRNWIPKEEFLAVFGIGIDVANSNND